jgi:uncharacterized protein YdaU (DUF1376 family)
MSERPFMQLYVSDFIGDTLQLSTEQIGAYMLLLMAMWNAGGKLPADDKKLSRIVRMSVKKWRSISAEITPFFEGDADHIWHNRLTKELRKSERQSQSRSDAGAKGAAAKALKNNNRPQANAKAKEQAGLKHLPEPYRKKGFSDFSKDPQIEAVKLDRWADETLFKACERIMGAPVPEFQQFKSFPADVVEQARKESAH